MSKSMSILILYYWTAKKHKSIDKTFVAPPVNLHIDYVTSSKKLGPGSYVLRNATLKQAKLNSEYGARTIFTDDQGMLSYSGTIYQSINKLTNS